LRRRRGTTLEAIAKSLQTNLVVVMKILKGIAAAAS